MTVHWKGKVSCYTAYLQAWQNIVLCTAYPSSVLLPLVNCGHCSFRIQIQNGNPNDTIHSCFKWHHSYMGWDLGLPLLCKGEELGRYKYSCSSGHGEEPRQMSPGWNSSACSERISRRWESLLKENLRECQPQGVPGSETELELGRAGGWCGLVQMGCCTAAPQGSSVFVGGPSAASLPKPQSI